MSSLATMLATETSSLAGFFAATFVAGIGFGAGMQGGMRTVLPLVAEHERPRVLSVLYLICYVAMGLPAVAAGSWSCTAAAWRPPPGTTPCSWWPSRSQR
ncbi:hypothetical protein [Streptomyces sparsogenes]|uniref:hypothetical protein n=1 Tax=Streptomyces sparsogenes TaxID=67365 RepID=UPI0033CE9406